MKNRHFMKPSLYSSVTSATLTGFFGYTAASKLLDFTRFRAVLSASPLIAKGAGTLAGLLVAAELTVVLLLIFPRTRLWGLYASFVLLILFTSYLGYMVLYTPHLPCSCGGVLEALSWKEHILLNLVLLILTLAALLNEQRLLFSPLHPP
jgi:hypothetical protein